MTWQHPVSGKVFDVLVTATGYQILRDEADNLLAIRCRTCGMISYNPMDRIQKYCANCRVFLGGT